MIALSDGIAYSGVSEVWLGGGGGGGGSEEGGGKRIKSTAVGITCCL